MSTIVLSEADGNPRPVLLVTVGSDHHPFNRLVEWVDRWLADGGADRMDCVMQFGTARAPHHAVGEAFMSHDVLQGLMRQASIIVMQGGPMGMLEARKQGSIPISVPRRRALGEVVDDHQAAFCRHMQATGDTVAVEDEVALRSELERGLANPSLLRSEALDFRARTEASVARFAQEADALLGMHANATSARYRMARPQRARAALRQVI